MSDPDLDDAASELYSLDPSEFVAARTSAVAAAKDAGNKKRAAAIGTFRKPTVVGWMVNLLVREEPEDIADLFDLGDRLRDAQRHSTNRELRELSADRQKSVRALTARAVELAASHGYSANDNAAREVGQTLTAALADPEIAERVRAGRVVTAESYSGFGPALLSVAPEPDDDADTAPGDGPDDGPDDDGPDDDAPDEDAAAEAQQKLDDARKDEEAARTAADAARSQAEEAATRLSDVKERLARLRAELHDAEAEEAEARSAEKSTERESRRLRRVLDDAEAQTAELENAILELKK